MIAQHSNWLSIVLTTVVAASALLSVQGCGSDDPTNDLPSLRELGPRVPERSENDLPVENEDRLVLQGEQLYLPLYVPLADAWSQVDEQAVPALTRQLWQANGMRIGLLRSGQYRELVKRLPEQMHRTNSIIRTSQVPGTLVISPAINQPHTVDLTVPPRPVREQRVADGRLQLLVEATGTGLGSVPLRIMPHHYKPRVSLRPVDPMRRHLEGASFGELAINVALAPGEALVVGLKREWAETDQEVGNESDASPEQVAETQEQPPGLDETGFYRDATPVDAPPIPYHIGRAIFAGKLGGNPYQKLVILSIASRSEAPSTPVDDKPEARATP